LDHAPTGEKAVMGTFVLVHGSWHGGWCWSRLVPMLRAEGHDVHAPSLSGLGDRVHLATPGIGLSTHITDITNLITYEDLDDVVLVGASYGGPVISGVGAALPERVRRLVFVDGLVPDAGQSCFDLMPGVRPGFVESARAAGSDWAVPSPPPQFFGIAEPADVRWTQDRLTAMPLKTHDERLAVSPPDSIPGTYIRCDQFIGFDQQMEPARRRGYAIEHLDAGHDVQITDARALKDVLTALET
jgi:pimeloyl-ACP methyl ester carboxylesterase